MTAEQDAHRLVYWMRHQHMNKWVDMLAICKHFGWQPGNKTYLRMSLARDLAYEHGMCLTFATYGEGHTPRYKLTDNDGDNVVPGMATRASAASTQWRRIGYAGQFVSRHGSDRLSRKVGKLASQMARRNAEEQEGLAEVLAALNEKQQRRNH